VLQKYLPTLNLVLGTALYFVSCSGLLAILQVKILVIGVFSTLSVTLRAVTVVGKVHGSFHSLLVDKGFTCCRKADTALWTRRVLFGVAGFEGFRLKFPEPYKAAEHQVCLSIHHAGEGSRVITTKVVTAIGDATGLNKKG
jgi:hypothetical protein